MFLFVCLLDWHLGQTVHNAFRIYDQIRDKWFLMVAKSPEVKEQWLRAFANERYCVHEDKENSLFTIVLFMFVYLFYIIFYFVYLFYIATFLETVVGVSKGMLPVRYFCSNKASFLS